MHVGHPKLSLCTKFERNQCMYVHTEHSGHVGGELTRRPARAFGSSGQVVDRLGNFIRSFSCLPCTRAVPLLLLLPTLQFRNIYKSAI